MFVECWYLVWNVLSAVHLVVQQSDALCLGRRTTFLSLSNVNRLLEAEMILMLAIYRIVQILLLMEHLYPLLTDCLADEF